MEHHTEPPIWPYDVFTMDDALALVILCRNSPKCVRVEIQGVEKPGR